MRILAAAKQGQWSTILFGLFIFFFVVMDVLVASGQRGDETIFDNLALSVPALLAAGSLIMAFGLGALGI